MEVKSKRHITRIHTGNVIPKWTFVTEYYTQPLGDFLKFKIYDFYHTFSIKTKLENLLDWWYYSRLDIDELDEDHEVEIVFNRPSIKASLKVNRLLRKNAKVYKSVGSLDRPKSWRAH